MQLLPLSSPHQGLHHGSPEVYYHSTGLPGVERKPLCYVIISNIESNRKADPLFISSIPSQLESWRKVSSWSGRIQALTKPQDVLFPQPMLWAWRALGNGLQRWKAGAAGIWISVNTSWSGDSLSWISSSPAVDKETQHMALFPRGHPLYAYWAGAEHSCLWTETW